MNRPVFISAQWQQRFAAIAKNLVRLLKCHFQ